jgi:hypothetical protein
MEELSMRTCRASLGVLLWVFFVTAAWSADISGQWKGEWTDYGSRDIRQNTLTFKQDGANLTGTLSSEGVELQIREGKVSGDVVSFVVVQKIGNREATMNYTGRITGSEIRFKVSFPGAERSWDMTARKVL